MKCEVESDQRKYFYTNLQKTWLQYCSGLLLSSKTYVENRKKAMVLSPSDKTNIDIESFRKIALITDDDLRCRFPKNTKLECPEDNVTDYKGAKDVFLVGREAAIYLMSNHDISKKGFETVDQLSTLYKILAFYDGLKFIKTNTYSRVSKMHKRRVVLWKTIISKNKGKIYTNKKKSGNFLFRLFLVILNGTYIYLS